MSSRPHVAVVGLGAMGSRLATHLLQAGYPLTAASRRPDAIAALEAAGARTAASPAAAVASCDVALVCVTDDDASRLVWTDPVNGVLPALAAGAVGVELSTLTPTWVRELAQRAGSAGHVVVEAPMIGSLPQVEARALVHLIGGDDPDDRVHDVLSVSAARLVPTGPHGSAAVLKLIVNGLLATQVAVLAELLAGARDATVEPARVLEVLMSLPVLSPAAGAAAQLVLDGAPQPRFPVRLVRKDLRYLLREAGSASGVAAAVLSAFDRAAADGLDDADITAVGQVLGLGRHASAADAATEQSGRH